MIALSEDQRVRRQLALEWGVVPGACRRAPPRAGSSPPMMLERAREVGGLESDDMVVLAYGPPGAGGRADEHLAVRQIP